MSIALFHGDPHFTKLVSQTLLWLIFTWHILVSLFYLLLSHKRFDFFGFFFLQNFVFFSVIRSVIRSGPILVLSTPIHLTLKVTSAHRLSKHQSPTAVLSELPSSWWSMITEYELRNVLKATPMVKQIAFIYFFGAIHYDYINLSH